MISVPSLGRPLALLGAFVISDASLAQDTETLRKGVARCAAQSGELARLACYDELAESEGLTITTSTGISAGSKWVVQDSTNPIDDSRTVTLLNTAEEGESSFGRPVSLVIRCMSNTTELYISWNDYLGSKANVLTRVGRAEAKRQEWSMSTDKKATFYPGNDIAFIKSIMESDSFVAQATPYNESPVTAIWDVSGLSSAIEPLRATCSW